MLVVVENPTGAGPWWAERVGQEVDDEDASPGGTFTPGSLVVLDRDLHEEERLRLDVDVPVGWFPADDADGGLGAPRFASATRVAVRVPVEGERVVSLGTG